MTADHDRRSADHLADQYERRAERARRAAASELRTEEHLDRELVPLGYHCLHDCRWPGSRSANIDHIVIGPTGVWVVDDTVMTNRVYVGRDGRLRSGRHSMTKKLLNVHAQTAAVRTAIDTTHARGVVTIHEAELPSPSFDADGVLVAGALWPTSAAIQRAPRRLHRDEVERLADHARRALAPRSFAVPQAASPMGEISVADVLDPRLPRAPREPSARQRSRRPSARQRRRRPSALDSLMRELSRIAVAIVALVIVVTVAFAAFSAFGRSMLATLNKPTVTYSCMQVGQPGRMLHVHWSDSTVSAVLWRTNAFASWEPLAIEPASSAERAYLLPKQQSFLRLERAGGRDPIELSSTAPATPC